MKEAQGTYKPSPKGNTGLIYVPAKMAVDSAFPLKEGKLKLRVDGKRLIVEQDNSET